MGVGQTVKVGDTSPPVTYQLRCDPTHWSKAGDPVDLTDAARVDVAFRHSALRNLIHSVEGVEVVDAVNGIVSTPLVAAITARPGLVAFEWIVHNGDGTVQTFPSTPRTGHNHLMVRSDLGSSAGDGVLGSAGSISMASAGITESLANQLLDMIANGVAFTPPTEVAAQFHIGDPGEGLSALAAETSRLPLTFVAAQDRATSNDNSALIAAVAASETYRGLSLWDSSTPGAGSPLYTAAFLAPYTVAAGAPVTLSANDVDVAHGGALTSYAANTILDLVLRGVAVSPPAQLAVQLHTGPPGLDALANVSATADRVAVGAMTPSANSLVFNQALIRWPSITAAEIITHISVWDAVTGGNPWWQGALSSASAAQAGAPFDIAAGQLALGIS